MPPEERPTAPMNVSEEQITALVHRFYDAARADDSLGPLFSGAITEWESHMATVADFWSHVLLGTKRYKGFPFPAHRHLPIELEHFERWMALFTRAADETLPQEAAQKVKARAAHMTESFRCGLFPFIGADGKPAREPSRIAARR